MLVVSGCKEEIIHDLSEHEANRLLTSLHQKSIDGSKSRQADGKWAISVEKDEILLSLSHLGETRFFKSKPPKLPESSGIVSSRDEQRFQFERALSREIESTLLSVAGVLEARVHLNLPILDPLFGRPVNAEAKGSGSVLIVSNTTEGMTESNTALIVSGASGIPKDNITVVINIESQQVAINESKDLISKIAVEESSNEEKHKPWLLGAGVSLLLLGALFIRKSKPPVAKPGEESSDKEGEDGISSTF